MISDCIIVCYIIVAFLFVQYRKTGSWRGIPYVPIFIQNIHCGYY